MTMMIQGYDPSLPSLTNGADFQTVALDAYSRSDILYDQLPNKDKTNLFYDPILDDFPAKYQSFECDPKIMSDVVKMASNGYKYVNTYIGAPDFNASCSVQFAMAFPLQSTMKIRSEEAANEDQKNDDDDDDDEHTAKLDKFCADNEQKLNPKRKPHGLTTYALDNDNIFRKCDFSRKKMENPYKARECRFHPVLVDLYKERIESYPVTSMIAPYGVIENGQRKFVLNKTADLYGIITNSIQMIYTSMMGMVYFDLIITTNDGQKLGRRIMEKMDFISIISACFGQWDYGNLVNNTHELNIKTDWNYLKVIAATYGQAVNETFKRLLVKAVREYNPTETSKYEITKNEIEQLVKTVGITDIDEFELQYPSLINMPYDVTALETQSDDEEDDNINNDDIEREEEKEDDTLIANMMRLLNEVEDIMNNDNNYDEDPWMQQYDPPDFEQDDDDYYIDDDEKVLEELNESDNDSLSRNENEEKCIERSDDESDENESVADDEQKVKG